MKKQIRVLLVAVSFLSLLSCSKDNEESITIAKESESNFFNLKVGNIWVYKYYVKPKVVPNEVVGTNYEHKFYATSKIDTVRITDSKLIDGKVYYNEETKSYRVGELKSYQTSKRLLTINSKGHLVNFSGATIHPGKDTNQSNYYSNIKYQDDDFNTSYFPLKGPLDLVVEEKPYSVYYFRIDYSKVSSFGSYALPSELKEEEFATYYQDGLGLIQQNFASIEGDYLTLNEKRMISFFNEKK